MPTLRNAVPALLLAALVLAPFHGKPFTIDDPVFLMEARHALGDPLHPTAFEIAWWDDVERVSTLLPTGPVMAWILMPVVYAGGSETLAHAIQLVLLLAAILATVSLASRLGLSQGWASAAGLLVASTPAALAMAGTAMPDVAALAFGVAGIERLVARRQGGRPVSAALAALLLGVAALTRMHLLLLVVVGAALVPDDPFTVRGWREVPRSRWLPLAAAPAVTLGLTLLTADPGAQAGTIGGAAARYSRLVNLAPNAVAFAAHWVLALIFALPWAALRWRALLHRGWIVIAASGAAALAMLVPEEPPARWLVALAAGLGAAVLVDVMAVAWERRDRTQLALGLWMLLPLATAIYIHLPSKYLVPSAPAAAILLAREASRNARLSRPLLAASVAIGACLGVAILRADTAFAEIGRNTARAIIRPQVAAGRHVWFLGHWGFQWYAEQAGATFFSMSPPYPMRGDLVVASTAADPPFEMERLGGLVAHVGRFESGGPGGRVMDKASGAGFFSTGWGYLPWSWSDGVLEAVDVWQFVQGPVRAEAGGRPE